MIVSFVGLWHHLQHFVHRWIFLAALIAWGIDVSIQPLNSLPCTNPTYLQRIYRLTTVIWKNCGSRLTKATIQLLPGDVARVDVSAVRPGKLNAGQYMFLYIPALGLWTSHPFSAAWKSLNRPRSFHSEKSGNTVRTLLGGGKSERMMVSFLIRKKDGFTKKMMRSITNGRRLNAMALAEGPYGMILSFLFIFVYVKPDTN